MSFVYDIESINAYLFKASFGQKNTCGKFSPNYRKLDTLAESAKISTKSFAEYDKNFASITE
jgi:hypothetical protein